MAVHPGAGDSCGSADFGNGHRVVALAGDEVGRGGQDAGLAFGIASANVGGCHTTRVSADRPHLRMCMPIHYAWPSTSVIASAEVNADALVAGRGQEPGGNSIDCHELSCLAG